MLVKTVSRIDRYILNIKLQELFVYNTQYPNIVWYAAVELFYSFEIYRYGNRVPVGKVSHSKPYCCA